MKYISWNINSVRMRMPILQKLLNDENPEIVMLQETKCIEEVFPYSSITGYNSYVYGQKSYNGVAILVRSDINICGYEQIPLCNSPEARCIKAIIGDTTFISVYVPCGGSSEEKYEYKKWFLHDLVPIINNVKTQKVVVGGDFNVAITNEDVEYPTRERLNSVLCREDVRELMIRLISLANLSDFVSKNRFTWWDYREPHKGLRIDHILVRGLNGIQIPKQSYRRLKLIYNTTTIGPSDHVPIVFSGT